MRKTPVWVALATLLFFLQVSCQKDDSFGPDTAGKVNFEHPEPGQQSRYLLLKGENYNSGVNASYTYFADTLITEIVSVDKDGIRIKEFLSAGSASLNGENNVSFADAAIYYYLKIEDEMLTIHHEHFRMTSRLYFMNGASENGLTMQQIEALKVELKGWKTNLPYATKYYTAFAENVELLGQRYERLNVVIDNRNMRGQGSGHTHVYSKKYGLVRSSQYNSFNFKGFGWDLLP